MATNTPNYNLTKQDPTEFYDIGVVNDNLDKIDTAIKDVDTQLTQHSEQITELENNTQKASNTEALEGTNDSTVMTPLRVAESIDNRAIKKNDFDSNLSSVTGGHSNKLSRTFTTNFTGTGYGRWAISFPKQAFFGTIEFNFSAAYGSTNSSGGMKAIVHLGVIDDIMYNQSKQIISASEQFLNNYYFSDFVLEGDNYTIYLHKRVTNANNRIVLEMIFREESNDRLRNINNTLTHNLLETGTQITQTNASYYQEINNLKSQYSSRFAEMAAAITGKGVQTAANANASTIISNINAIPTGSVLPSVRYASGTATSGTTPLSITYSNGQNAGTAPSLSASLDFIPSTIVYNATSGSNRDEYVYRNSRTGSGTVVAYRYSENVLDGVTTHWSISGNFYVNSSGFNLPVFAGGATFEWRAYG